MSKNILYLIIDTIFSIIYTILIIALLLYGVSGSSNSCRTENRQEMTSINFSRGTGMDYSDPNSKYDDGDIYLGEENGYYIYEGKGGTYKILK